VSIEQDFEMVRQGLAMWTSKEDVAFTALSRIEAEVDRLRADLKATDEWSKKVAAENVRLLTAIRAYVVAVMRAPNNRDEAEIEATSMGLVQALEKHA
jgi:hypothetical protein